MGILNRDEGADAATPGILRFTSPEQAAGFFMLGETSKTSAAGKERGKTRSPFTQPFFPGKHGLQAERFAELAATMDGVTMWLMNTGYVGGDSRDVKDGKALKVKIPHSSAMLEALLAEHIQWKIDPDFGYEIVDVDNPENASLLAKVPMLQALSEQERVAIAGKLQTERFEAGEPVMEVGEQGDAMYFLDAGEAEAETEGDYKWKQDAGGMMGGEGGGGVEASPDTCMDGVDNDNDGDVDCSDPSCVDYCGGEGGGEGGGMMGGMMGGEGDGGGGEGGGMMGG